MALFVATSGACSDDGESSSKASATAETDATAPADLDAGSTRSPSGAVIDAGNARTPTPSGNHTGSDAGPTLEIDASGDGAHLTLDASLVASDDAARSDASMAQSGSVQISANGFTFEARVAGPESGELVLLLHGFPETSFEWRAQLPALAAAGYRAVAPDQRGYSPGARPAAVDDYQESKLAQDVVAIADALGAQRFHVVGHDWGAAVAWVVAGTAADRVISLNALSVPHPDAFAKVLSDKSSCQYQASSYFDFFSMDHSEDQLLANNGAFLRSVYGGIDPTAVDEYLRVLGTTDALRAALNWYRANVGARNLMTPPLGPITVPTLYIWSDGDTALCREGADLTKDYVEGPYDFQVIMGVDHWIADRAPDQLNTLLLAHLDQFRERK